MYWVGGRLAPLVGTKLQSLVGNLVLYLLQNPQRVSEFLKPAREDLGVRAVSFMPPPKKLVDGELKWDATSAKEHASPGTNNGDNDSSESNGLPQSSRNVPPPPPSKS
ncbi:hypothetical protein MUK42_34038 [Musa troglodytarum]|uniref:Uncharacterized protein n=1 Tax=Musa troglodytarum TaxID=320322 RepID=A0A9E7JAX0_9LILI|nr:hypothetical protein MUK42_34038 [Musa troglodytarum]